jgi:hypothetical protein
MQLLGNAVLAQRLSPKEREFARQYVLRRASPLRRQRGSILCLLLLRFVVLFENHMHELALGKLAEEHQSLSSEGMGTEACRASLASRRRTDTPVPCAVPEPDLDCFVFCESKDDLPNVQVDDRGADTLTLRRNDRLVLRYRSIQPYVQDGQAALI